jgi:hypothetical protein
MQLTTRTWITVLSTLNSKQNTETVENEGSSFGFAQIISDLK